MSPQECFRVPGLVIVGHGDSRRVGEEVALPQLGPGATVALSRLEPAFAMPNTEIFRPLDDAYLSRRPVILSPGTEPGSVRVDRAGSSTTVSVDAEDIT